MDAAADSSKIDTIGPRLTHGFTLTELEQCQRLAGEVLGLVVLTGCADLDCMLEEDREAAIGVCEQKARELRDTLLAARPITQGAQA